MSREGGSGPRRRRRETSLDAARRSRRAALASSAFTPPTSIGSLSDIEEALVFLDQLRGSLDHLRKLRLVTDAALANLTVDDLLDELLIRVREVLSSDTAAILLLDTDRNELVARAAKGLEEEVEQKVRIPVGKGFAGKIAATGKPVTIEDVDHADVLNPILREKGVRSLLGVPLVANDELLGVLHVGTLTPRDFTDEDRDLLQLVGDRVALAINAGLYERERAVASSLQQAFLPEDMPTAAGITLRGRYVPAPGGDVGGDWYDVFLLPDGCVAVVIGDVVGRGLPAASIMAKLRNALRAYALEHPAPGDVLGRMNRLIEHLEPDHIATVFYGTLDPVERIFRFASAGHVPPVIRDPDGSVRIRWINGGPPLGTMFAGTFTDNVEQLEPGAVFVLYTDGLIERRERTLDEGLRRLSDVCRSKRSADEMCLAILDELGQDREADDDDVTLLVIAVSDEADR